MRVVIQRSGNSTVSVDGNIVVEIKKGLVVFVGFKVDDTVEDVNYIVKKISKLRIFDDENGNKNLSIKDVNGEILSISQFTLYADTNKGNRPSYIKAMPNTDAKKLYNKFNELLEQEKINVETGIFGADMKVNITNDGPITIIINSKEK